MHIYIKFSTSNHRCQSNVVKNWLWQRRSSKQLWMRIKQVLNLHINYVRPHTTSFNKLFYSQYWNFPLLYKQVTFLFLLHCSAGFSPTWYFAALIILSLQLLMDCNFFSSCSVLLASSFYLSTTGHLLLPFLLGAITAEYILNGFWSLCFLFAGRWLSLLSLAIVRQIPSNMNLQNSTAFTGITLLCINRRTGLKFKDASCVTTQEQHHCFLSSV